MKCVVVTSPLLPLVIIFVFSGRRRAVNVEVNIGIPGVEHFVVRVYRNCVNAVGLHDDSNRFGVRILGVGCGRAKRGGSETTNGMQNIRC